MKETLSGCDRSTGSASRILALLYAAEPALLSGEEISRKLNVSRSAVWKQIQGLRNKGYTIESQPSRGYRLIHTPEKIHAATIKHLLKSERIGREIIFQQEVVSTNAVAFRLAEEGAPEGTVVVADSQSGGKGRLGRQWASPPGVNLYCSVILCPPVQPVAAPQLTFLSAVAVARAVEQVSGVDARIKWPNDLLVGGKKIAGLLNEMSAETDKVNFVILGIGVNLNMSDAQFPVGLRHPATSLLIESGSPVDRTVFARVLLQELDALYADFLREGYAPVRQEWLRRSRLEGARVTVTDAGVVRHGVVTGIDEYGALILTDGERILSGDVSFE